MIERGLEVVLPASAIEAVAVRVAELLAERAEKSPWMTRDEAAEYLRCSRSWLEKRRDVPCVRDSGRVLYHRDELDAYLLSQPRKVSNL